MHTTVRYSILAILSLVGFLFPRFAGAVPGKTVNVSRMPNSQLLQGEATPTFTSLPTNTVLPLASTFTPFASTEPQTISVSGNVYAFVQAPEGYVEKPYVILTGFSVPARSGVVEVRGYENTREFVCSSLPCAITLDASSRLIFHAITESGTMSEEVIASVSVTQDAQGYLVQIDSISLFTPFVDACSVIWNVRDEKGLGWNEFVQYPYQLNTNKTLHNLATQLLLNGVVDAKDCPAGGLSLSLNWPTACGLERASEEMTAWQNQFDEYIWLASKKYGIPPKILKTVIEIESQFWPGNTRAYLEEYGLGQINQLGVDVLLRRDPSVYQEVCPGVLANCSIPYGLLDEEDQDLIRGALVKSADTSCSTCAYGFDLDKARDSISLIANLLRANCQQVKDVLQKDVTKVKYEDLWRFMLSNYHNGVNCFYEAIQDARVDKKELTWENISKRLRCGRGAEYVEDVMDGLLAFDFYTYRPGDLNESLVPAVIVPTKIPAPTPTAFVSDATIQVQVYMDRNANGVPENGEWIDGMSVLVAFPGGDEINRRTENGFVTFDMSGYRPGLNVVVSLPGLYRSESFILPQHGEVEITFKFDQPALPTILP